LIPWTGDRGPQSSSNNGIIPKGVAGNDGNDAGQLSDMAKAAKAAPVRGDNQDEKAASIRMTARRYRDDLLFVIGGATLRNIG
jgi:hypothetical protein